MSTYRERREARTDRLREWAAKREAKAASEHETANRMADAIPFGQPILVGHHSESRDRRYRDRIWDTMGRAVEDDRKAREMASKADEIERQADIAIYDDDPDAIERLTAKLADLEAEREGMKARNAAYRRDHRDELKAMTPYDRSLAVPHAAYELQNLGGNITRTRQRLAQLTSRKERTGTTAKPARLLTLRYAGVCIACRASLPEGSVAFYDRAAREVTCRPCYEKDEESR